MQRAGRDPETPARRTQPRSRIRLYNRQPCVQSTQLTLLMTVGMHLPDRTLRKLPGGDTKLQEHLWQVWIILWHTGISVAQVLRLA
jgi:hypothetical protein